MRPIHPKSAKSFSRAAKLLLVGILAAMELAACRRTEPAAEQQGSDLLNLSSTSMQNGRFPAEFTCDGADHSPALAWKAPPSGTQSLAILLYDRDTPGNGFVHWVLFNLPPEMRSLPEGFQQPAENRSGTQLGVNDFGRIGYGGPCPPTGTHHYIFKVFALENRLSLPAGATRAQLDQAIQGHVLARGTLTAAYSH